MPLYQHHDESDDGDNWDYYDSDEDENVGKNDDNEGNNDDNSHDK